MPQPSNQSADNAERPAALLVLEVHTKKMLQEYKNEKKNENHKNFRVHFAVKPL